MAPLKEWFLMFDICSHKKVFDIYSHHRSPPPNSLAKGSAYSLGSIFIRSPVALWHYRHRPRKYPLTRTSPRSVVNEVSSLQKRLRAIILWSASPFRQKSLNQGSETWGGDKGMFPFEWHLCSRSWVLGRWGRQQPELASASMEP